MPSKRWQLTCRSCFKAPSDSVFTFLEWLGPFIQSWSNERPQLIGYIEWDNEERPSLLWHQGTQVFVEDLNVDQAPPA